MKVTLLGDSIRMQYGPEVKALLGEAYQVWYPEDNCRFTKYTIRGLFDWAQKMEGSEIVHWNNGHWDFCDLFGDGPFTTEEEYVKNVMYIVELLQKKHKIIIFATTTPVKSGNHYNTNDITQRFNALIVPKLKEKGVIINDLNATVCQDIDRYLSEDTIHLSEEGIRVCARQVADCIRQAAAVARTQPDMPTEAQQPEEKLGAPVLI